MSHSRTSPLRYLFLSTLTVALLLGGSAAEAQQQRSRVAGYLSRLDTTFSFEKNGTVVVTAGSGNIVVTGWSKDQIRARATSETDNIRFDVAGTRVTIEVLGSRGSESVTEISVPYGTQVIARAQSGDISVSGTRGDVEARTQSGEIGIRDIGKRLDINSFSGDVTVERAGGDADIVTTSGEVRVTDLAGNLEIRTVSGDIGLRGIASKQVRATTTSGDVRFEGAIDPSGSYDFSVHSGDIELRVPHDASALFSITTWSGGIDSAFPITLAPGEHGIGSSSTKKFTFAIGSGGARITARSFSGDITISRTGSRGR